MPKPLVLVFYENLLLGNQLVNRLGDLGYRVQMVTDAGLMPKQAISDKPFLIVTQLATRNANVTRLISEIRQDSATAHIPILAVMGAANNQVQEEARTAGATLVSLEVALLAQLPHLLQQVLEIE